MNVVPKARWSVTKKGLDDTKGPWPGLAPDVPIDGEPILHPIAPLGLAGRGGRELAESHVTIDSVSSSADRFGVEVDGVDLLDTRIYVFEHDGLIGPALHVVLQDLGHQHVASHRGPRLGAAILRPVAVDGRGLEWIPHARSFSCPVAGPCPLYANQVVVACLDHFHEWRQADRDLGVHIQIHDCHRGEQQSRPQ